MMSYGDRVSGGDRYNSEDSLEDNQSTTSSTESRQSDFQKKEHEFIPTRSSGILASKPAANPAQFTRINSNPLLISAQKQMLLVEEVKKKKKEVKVGDETPEWQSNLDGWKQRRRKQSEEAIVRVSEIARRDSDQAANGNRKPSIGKKISASYLDDDEIDFGDLESSLPEAPAPSANEAVASPSNSLTSGAEAVQISNGSRRESRGISQEKVIPEEPEYEEEISSPYRSAIEGYKKKMTRSEAKSQISDTSKDNHINKDIGVSLAPSQSSSLSVYDRETEKREDLIKGQSKDLKYEEEWEAKIETFVQPARRVSSEISDKMKQKLASFEDSKSGKEDIPVRHIEADNTFRDKLKAFKTIETSVAELPSISKPARRESEPNLAKKPKEFLTNRSTSSSFMNTIQNNKFFQQNSLGSENEEDSLGPNDQLLDDALEESFNVLEDNKDDAKNAVVFSADDFLPMTGRVAPPQEKPPPLPANPPPPLSSPHQKTSEENDIDKQEREIIESLEREEKEQKRYVQTDFTETSIARGDTAEADSRVVVLPQQSSQTSQTPQSVWAPAAAAPQPPPVILQDTEPRTEPRKKEKGELKDYNKHWLIQEAEQRRISEAKQKQNLNIMQSQIDIETRENINNNNSGSEIHNSFGDMRTHNVSDNIYANVDSSSSNLNHCVGAGAGPQVPPRQGEPPQDRVLSVSGKKKCSHCKEELGRGAAMIIESLRLFYHIRCFKCCVCSIQLGNGETGTDVRVRNNRLHCQNCYSNDEGLKFSKV